MQRTRTRLGPYFSEGCRLLWLALGAHGWNANRLRLRMRNRKGVPLASGQVNGWLYGDKVPSTFYVAQLDTLLNVPSAAWCQPPAEQFTLAEAA